MKYWGYMPNDLINGQGVSVSLWVSGCPFHCEGCHNQKAWDYESGYDVPDDLIDRLETAITANGIFRHLSILGGEPLCPENREFVHHVITELEKRLPGLQVYVWTGYTYDELREEDDLFIDSILLHTDVLIDGRFELEHRDTTLKMRGSTNQNIIELDNIK